MFTFPIAHFEGLSGAETLDTIGLTATCLFDMDATNSLSTSTANKFLNSITANTEYDCHLGTPVVGDGAEPTLTGTGKAQHYAHDGGDFFQVIDDTGTIMEDMHKTSGGAGAVWIGVAYQAVSSVAGALYGNFNGSGSDFGTRFLVFANGAIRLLIGEAAGSNFFNSDIVPSSTIVAEDILIFITWDTSDDTKVEVFFHNSATGTAWDVSFAAPTSITTIATNPWMWMANGGTGGSPSGIMASGTRFYGCYGGTGLLSDADMAKIKTQLESRHGRNYT